jgi:predicted enzyme related to lactoylglutathione lyase
MDDFTPVPNTVAHFAINADDVERGRAFYEAAFGWSFRPWGPPGFYQIDMPSKKPASLIGALQGRRELTPGSRTIGFECTIAVDDIAAACKRIEAAGGKITLGPVTIPTVGDLAFFEDTEGNVAGVMQYLKR